MHAERHGNGKRLLLHGLGSSLRTWDPVVPALAARREVIAVDLPGFGRTPPLAGLDSDAHRRPRCLRGGLVPVDDSGPGGAG